MGSTNYLRTYIFTGPNLDLNRLLFTSLGVTQAVEDVV